MYVERAVLHEVQLPKEHPAFALLEGLSRTPTAFQNHDTLTLAGFRVLDGERADHCWQQVYVEHDQLKGYLLQLAPIAEGNEGWSRYLRWIMVERVRQHRRVEQLIAENRWDRLVSPKSWFYQPPWNPPFPMILREALPLQSRSETFQMHRGMELQTVVQLLRLHAALETRFEKPKKRLFVSAQKVAILADAPFTGKLDGFNLRFLPYLNQEIREEVRREWIRQLEKKEEEWPIGFCSPEVLDRIDPYLIDPCGELAQKINALLPSPATLADRGSAEAAGFEGAEEAKRYQSSLLMVLRHPDLPHYLIKSHRFLGDRQNHYRYAEGYALRCERAEELADYIEQEGLHLLVVPRKGLHRLPDHLSSRRTPQGRYLLVVEELPLATGEEGVRRRQEISEELLRQLFRLMRKFELADFSPHNVPFTKTGRLALIDTEHIHARPTQEMPQGLKRFMGGGGRMSEVEKLWRESR